MIEIAQSLRSRPLAFLVAVSVGLTSVPGVALPHEIISRNSELFESAGSLSPQVALMVRKHETALPRAHVILIQDIHGCRKAQLNALKILSHLKGVDVVGLEGATGPIPLRAFRWTRYSEAVRQTAQFLFEKGWINGVEYYGLVTNYPPNYLGLESTTYYEKQIRAFQLSDMNRKMGEGLIQSLRAILDRQQLLVLSSRIIQLIEREERFLKTGDLREVLPLYLHLSMDEKIRYSNLNQWVKKLSSLNNQRDRWNVRKEDLGEISTDEFIVECLTLFHESIRRENPSKDALRWLRHFDTVRWMDSLMEHRLTSFQWKEKKKYMDQWEEILRDVYGKDSPQKWGESSDFLKHFLEFYELSDQRDQKLFETIWKYQNDRQDQTRAMGIVVYVGGYHTQGLVQRLENEKMSYVVLRPRADLEGMDRNYLNVFRPRHDAVGRMSEAAASLAPPCGLAEGGKGFAGQRSFYVHKLFYLVLVGALILSGEKQKAEEVQSYATQQGFRFQINETDQHSVSFTHSGGKCLLSGDSAQKLHMTEVPTPHRIQVGSTKNREIGQPIKIDSMKAMNYRDPIVVLGGLSPWLLYRRKNLREENRLKVRLWARRIEKQISKMTWKQMGGNQVWYGRWFDQRKPDEQRLPSIVKKKTDKSTLYKHVLAYILDKYFRETNQYKRRHVPAPLWLYWKENIDGISRSGYFYEYVPGDDTLPYSLFQEAGIFRPLEGFDSVNGLFQQAGFVFSDDTTTPENALVGKNIVYDTHDVGEGTFPSRATPRWMRIDFDSPSLDFDSDRCRKFIDANKEKIKSVLGIEYFLLLKGVLALFKEESIHPTFGRGDLLSSVTGFDQFQRDAIRHLLLKPSGMVKGRKLEVGFRQKWMWMLLGLGGLVFLPTDPLGLLNEGIFRVMENVSTIGIAGMGAIFSFQRTEGVMPRTEFLHQESVILADGRDFEGTPAYAAYLRAVAQEKRVNPNAGVILLSQKSESNFRQEMNRWKQENPSPLWEELEISLKNHSLVVRSTEYQELVSVADLVASSFPKIVMDRPLHQLSVRCFLGKGGRLDFRGMNNQLIYIVLITLAGIKVQQFLCEFDQSLPAWEAIQRAA